MEEDVRGKFHGKSKKALILGASGLVGSELLHFLLDGNYYTEVIALVRSPLGIKHNKLVEVICGDFDKLEEYEKYFAVEDVFCALGTTIKKAKTKDVMYKIDVEYPLELAKLTRSKGAKHLLLVSSMNANSKAHFWYPKIKGELEEQLKEVSFPNLSIFRPSLLLGDRKEFRLMENIAGKVFKGLNIVAGGKLSTTLAIEARTVAKAMYHVAQADTGKSRVSIYSSREMGDWD